MKYKIDAKPEIGSNEKLFTIYSDKFPNRVEIEIRYVGSSTTTIFIHKSQLFGLANFFLTAAMTLGKKT